MSVLCNNINFTTNILLYKSYSGIHFCRYPIQGGVMLEARKKKNHKLKNSADSYN